MINISFICVVYQHRNCRDRPIALVVVEEFILDSEDAPECSSVGLYHHRAEQNDLKSVHHVFWLAVEWEQVCDNA